MTPAAYVAKLRVNTTDDDVLARLLAVNHARGFARPMPDGHARPVALLLAGAHLYGTATPASDLDAKSVTLPAARDILLQRVKGQHRRQPGASSGAG